MNKKLAFIATLMLCLMIFAEAVLAIVPAGYPYGYAAGASPINPSLGGRYYPSSNPVRVGGFFGQNSAYVIGLRPGYYAGPISNTWTRTRLSSAYYPRVGGWFGQPGYSYSMRPGTFVFNGGYGTNYANANYNIYGY